MKKYELITDDAILADFLDSASTEIVAVDTEFMRENTYYPQLCLLQLQLDTQIACVDVFKVKDLSAFGLVWTSPKYIKILHSFRQDVEVLQLSLGLESANLFDTQIAAAFCGLGEQVSYAALVEQLCGVSLEKSQTRTDWSRRPLSMNQLHYAAEDVLYLPQIKDILQHRLHQKGMFDWFLQECHDVASSVSAVTAPNEAYQRLKGYQKLSQQAASMARSLACWREQVAQKDDVPREWVLPSAALIRIAELRPETEAQLKQINEVRSGRHRDKVFARVGQIIECLQNSSEIAGSDISYTPLESDQKRQLKAVIKRVQETAESLNISASLIANRKSLESFVRGHRDLALLQGWRKQIVGDALLQEFTE